MFTRPSGTGRATRPRLHHIHSEATPIRRLLVLVALAGVLAFPSAVFATHPNTCESGNNPSPTTYQKYAYHNWPGAPYLRYDGVAAETRVRDLAPCDDTLFNDEWGWSAVYVANMDTYTTGGNGFVQIGYMEASGIDVNGVAPGVRRFIYTPNDHNGGVFAVLNIPGIGNPIDGHRYKFSIRVGSNNTWLYCLQDRDGDNVERCLTQSGRTFTTATRTLYMFETANSSDALGNPESWPTTYIVEMQYRTSNGQWWFHDGGCTGTGGPGGVSHYQCIDGGTNDIRGYSL